MVLINENIAILVFTIIVVASVVIACWYEKYGIYDGGTFHVFIVVFTGLGVIITFLFYYNLIVLQGQQQQFAAIQELSRINDSVLNSVLDSLVESSTIIPNFVASITPLTNTVCCRSYSSDTTTCIIQEVADPVNVQTCTQKATLSYRIFALWQDILLSNKFISLDPVAYVSQFLQRANSQQLYLQWQVTSIDFSPDTQAFGDLLFEYGLPITNQTAQEYEETAKRLVSDPRFQTIISSSLQPINL